ncbi:CU044_2847 family protein [Streptomyces sp. NPDC047028]|uniref:CU044_2847 family protein n=1 Tax=Streptomyces sp. NPDC047028 TaxID=3155793 RepID=UPI00340E39A1
MGKLVEFTTDDGVVVVVETADPATGTRLVSRGENPAAQATRTFEGALDSVRAAAHSALSVFRDGALRPDSVELEFGVKLSAEAGAIIAKGAAEGQLVVRLGWNSADSADSGDPAHSGDSAYSADSADSGAAEPVPGPGPSPRS